MVAGDASIPIGEWGVGARLFCGTIYSTKGCLASVSHLGSYPAWCTMFGQGIEEFSSDPQWQERNAATFRVKKEANLSIVSDVSLTWASNTYYLVENFIYLYALYGRTYIRG